MPRLRVDPDQLRQSSQDLAGLAADLRAAGAALEAAAAGAPSYDGQFGPRARELASEGEWAAASLAGRLDELAGRLGRQAEVFAQAEAVALSGFGALNSRQRAGLDRAAAFFSAYASRPLAGLEAEEAYWLGLSRGAQPRTAAEWQAAAAYARLSLPDYLARSLGLPRATVQAFSALATTETKEVGLNAILLLNLTLWNRLQSGGGAISAGQYHALREMVAVRPDLFASVAVGGVNVLQRLAASAEGQVLLASWDDACLRRSLDNATYQRYQQLLNAAPNADPAERWRLLAQSGALNALLHPAKDSPWYELAAQARGLAAEHLQGVDLRTSGAFLSALAAYGAALEQGSQNQRLTVEHAQLGVGDLKVALLSAPEALAQRVRTIVLRWLGLPEAGSDFPVCQVEPRGRLVRVSFQLPGLNQSVTFEIAQDGTGGNLQIDLPGGRSFLARRAAETGLLLAAGLKLDDPAMFLPPGVNDPGFVDAVRRLAASGATFEANPDPVWGEIVQVFDPFQNAMRSLPRYAAQFLKDAGHFLAEIARLQADPPADAQRLTWLRDQAERRRLAAESLVWQAGPDGKHAFVAFAGMWPYIGGRPG